MKKVLKVFLSLALFFISIMPTSVLAEQSSTLMNIISGMYDESNNYKAFDSSGTETTSSFLATIRSDFLSQDENAIMEYMATTGTYLNRKIVNELPTPYTVTYMQCNIYEEYAEVLNQTAPDGDGYIMIVYSITSEPIYILETGEVITNPQPVATLIEANVPNNLVKLFSFSSRTTKSEDLKTVTLYWTFQTRMRYSQYLTTYDVAFERVNRSLTVTPSTY